MMRPIAPWQQMVYDYESWSYMQDNSPDSFLFHPKTFPDYIDMRVSMNQGAVNIALLADDVDMGIMHRWCSIDMNRDECLGELDGVMRAMFRELPALYGEHLNSMCNYIAAISLSEASDRQLYLFFMEEFGLSDTDADRIARNVYESGGAVSRSIINDIGRSTRRGSRDDPGKRIRDIRTPDVFGFPFTFAVHAHQDGPDMMIDLHQMKPIPAIQQNHPIPMDSLRHAAYSWHENRDRIGYTHVADITLDIRDTWVPLVDIEFSGYPDVMHANREQVHVIQDDAMFHPRLRGTIGFQHVGNHFFLCVRYKPTEAQAVADSVLGDKTYMTFNLHRISIKKVTDWSDVMKEMMLLNT